MNGDFRRGHLPGSNPERYRSTTLLVRLEWICKGRTHTEGVRKQSARGIWDLRVGK